MQSLKTPPGEIITFYSYKGGTGRSMALANVACLLAEKWSEDKGILMIDWDLEAPGLHRFFHDKFTGLSLREFTEKPGLIDLFLKLNEASPKSGFASQEEAKKMATDALDSVKLEEFIIKTDIPQLSLLKAGRIDKDYSLHVSNFDWESLYNLSPLLIRLFAERLSEQYRYVLIDSRTGYTDIGGICTMLMPQKLVVVFTPSRQSYDGTEELVKKATTYRRQSRDLRPLIVYPLPSRIEGSMEKLRTDWRFGNTDKGIPGYQPMFEKLFKEVYGLNECKLDEYFKNIQIQQSPDYAYGEDIAVKKIGQTKDRLSITESYEKFTKMLVSSDPPWQSTIEKINALYITAQRAYDDGKYKQALDAWKEVLEIDSENQTALEGIKAIKRIKTQEKPIVGKKEGLDRRRLVLSALTAIVGIIALYGFYVYVSQPPQLSVSSDFFSFNLGNMNIGETVVRSFSISNAGKGTLEWNVNADQPWITVNPKSGTGLGTINIDVNTTGLQPGSYSGVITVSSNGGIRSGSISFNLVPPSLSPPILSISNNSFKFAATSTGESKVKILDISNTGGGTLDWRARTDSLWIELNSMNGSNNGSIFITINTTYLTPGSHAGIITIESKGGTGQVAIEVNVPLPTPTLLPSQLCYHDNETDVTNYNIKLINMSAICESYSLKVSSLITIEFTLQNVGKEPVTFESTFIAARNPSNDNKDFQWQNQGETIQPQEIIKTKGSVIVDTKGIWNFGPAYSLKLTDGTTVGNPNGWRRFPILVE